MVHIPPDDAELLEQCDFEFFRSSGPGGQNVNRRETAVRLRHRPSGIVVTSRQTRTQGRNRELALAELRRRLEAMNRHRRPRIATRMSRATRERILESKREQAEKKRQRRKPGRED